MSKQGTLRSVFRRGTRAALQSERGFSLTEVSLVLAILGILMLLATPMFLSYHQASRLKVGAEELAAFLNQARQIGIKQNVGVCVKVPTTSTMQLRLQNCSGTVWVGAGTDASGNIRLPDGVRVTRSESDPDPIFNYLGAASSQVTYTVKNSQTNATLLVRVSTSGRVKIGP